MRKTVFWLKIQNKFFGIVQNGYLCFGRVSCTCEIYGAHVGHYTAEF